MAREGRSCPLAYRYAPADLCRQASECSADVLYVIGGLYGNILALDEIERMARAEEREGRRVQLVFNGDFNWFNTSDELFRAVNERVLGHTVSLGNVEYELADPSPGAGCGCAYPEFVDQGVVERSNRIIERLQGVASAHPDIQMQLADLPRYRCLIFGGLKVLVLHGDPESLAGWGLAHESFAEGNEASLSEWFSMTGADAMVCTHTCLPVLWSGLVAEQARLVVNNGSAGMGNLHGDPRGLITRISASRPSVEPVATLERRGLHFSLVPVAFDHRAWLTRFDVLWPSGSDAEMSYRNRLLSGTSLAPGDVVFPSGF
ncbi:metallophosphoesterase family protein [Marinobacter sp. DUT-1]|uniref:metallophosphoesterase family protein n=1 Tax=Marinobacter sp. DUT-1 TaxID=3412037 RepID=UPI003D17F242